MRVTLTYELSPRSYVALRDTLAPQALRAFRKGYWSWCALVSAPSLLGLALAVSDANLLFAVLFAALILAMLYQATRYKHEHHKAVAAEAAAIPVKTVQLVVDDSGLHETIAGVQSFAPWESVESMHIAADTVLLRLRSGSWSLIPASAFGPELPLPVFGEFVRAKRSSGQAADA